MQCWMWHWFSETGLRCLRNSSSMRPGSPAIFSCGKSGSSGKASRHTSADSSCFRMVLARSLVGNIQGRLLEVEFVEVAVAAAPGHQFVVFPALDDPAFLKHQHLVGVLHRLE